MTDYREKAMRMLEEMIGESLHVRVHPAIVAVRKRQIGVIAQALRNAHAAGKAEEQKRCTSATQACLFLIDKLEAFSREIQEEVRVLQQELVKDKTAQDGRSLPLSS